MREILTVKSDDVIGRAKTYEAIAKGEACLLYTSDAADERSSVDLGGRRIIKKKKNAILVCAASTYNTQAYCYDVSRRCSTGT